MTDPRLAFAKLANLTDKAFALLDEDARTDVSVWLDCAVRPFQAKLTECEQIVTESSDGKPQLQSAIDRQLVHLGSAINGALRFPVGPCIDELAHQITSTIVLFAAVVAPEQAAIAAKKLLPYASNGKPVEVPDQVREFLRTLGSGLRTMPSATSGSVRA